MPPILKFSDDKEALELHLSGCRGYEFRDALEKIKEVPGRRFDYDRKVWMVEATPDNADRIVLTIQPTADQEIHSWIRESKTKAQDELTTPLPDDAKLLVPWATERQDWQPESVNDEKFNGLLQYQRPMVEALVEAKRAVCADDVGLGKTLTSLTAVEEFVLRNPRLDGLDLDGPRLVIAPNSVKGSWRREIERWLPSPPLVMVDGTSPATRHKQIVEGIKNNAWVIVNWEQLRVKSEKVKFDRRGGGTGSKKVKNMKEPFFQYPQAIWDDRFPEDLAEWDWRMFEKANRAFKDPVPDNGWLAILADEVHRAKNKDAQQTQGLWRTQAKFMLGLTGTPIMNSPDELWAILRWLYPMEYTSYWDFFEKYVDYYENPFQGRVITGVKHAEALRFELKGRLFRRTSAVLGLKGRKRIYYPVPLNPGQQKLYDKAEKEMWLQVERDIQEGDVAAERFKELASEGATVSSLIRIPNGAARMVRLLQIIENAALVGGDDDSALMDDFEQKLQDSGDDAQWVVGCKYVESVAILKRRLEAKGISVEHYTGAVTPADRTKLEDRFQRGEVRVIVGTLEAMKEGITLTSGHLMYALSRLEVPDLNEQWEGRCDRLGQQNLVLVYIPQAENTIVVDKQDPRLRSKEKIVRSVFEKNEIKEERR